MTKSISSPVDKSALPSQTSINLMNASIDGRNKSPVNLKKTNSNMDGESTPSSKVSDSDSIVLKKKGDKENADGKRVKPYFQSQRS